LSIYNPFLLKTFTDITLRLYYINDEGYMEVFLFENKKYTHSTITLIATLKDEDGNNLVLNKTTQHIIPTLDTFTLPNNVTNLINENYGFDNVDY
jgi:hypothetical protein